MARDGRAALEEADAAMSRADLLAARHEIKICDPMRHHAGAVLAQVRGDVAAAERYEQAVDAALVQLTAR